jgi:thiamine biosynthesis lipoprotein
MHPEGGGVEARHFDALGTTCSLFGVGVSRRDLQGGEAWVRELGARLTRFTSTSEVARLNAAHGRWIDVSPQMEDVLRESLVAFELSFGLVNVAVLPSMLAIGYTQPLSEGQTVATLDRVRPLPQLPAVLEVRPGRARLEPGSGIDLGGIAKGWMADRLCTRLGGNVLVNLGGDLRAIGPGPEGAGWPVGLAGLTVMLVDRGAATSSVRRRSWNDLHHLIDPRTGLPAQSGLEEVSVVAGTGVAAEVIAKTALIGGPEVAPAYCASHALAWWLSPAP